MIYRLFNLIQKTYRWHQRNMHCHKFQKQQWKLLNSIILQLMNKWDLLELRQWESGWSDRTCHAGEIGTSVGFQVYEMNHLLHAVIWSLSSKLHNSLPTMTFTYHQRTGTHFTLASVIPCQIHCCDSFINSVEIFSRWNRFMRPHDRSPNVRITLTAQLNTTKNNKFYVKNWALKKWTQHTSLESEHNTIFTKQLYYLLFHPPLSLCSLHT